MTVFQIQLLLAYLGYPVKPDGIDGPQTQGAVKTFQRYYGLDVDGIAGRNTQKALKDSVAYDKFKPPDTATEDSLQTEKENGPELGPADDWDKIKYFKREEFACKCGQYCDGFPVEVDLGMVAVMDKIREEVGKPIRINSGIRCKRHNSNVGGVANSRHLYGSACDAQRPAGTTPEQMAAIAEKHLPNSGGIGIYSWGIHVDTRPDRARWRG